MKVLVVGGGGREHAIAWRIAQDPAVRQVYCVPGNAGAMADVSCIPGNIMDAREMLSLAASLGVDLTVIGPEAPLVEGIADKFRSAGHAVVGPSAAGARLEGSKAFAKDFMAENGIPTARSVLLENLADVERTIGCFGYPVVLKADGLAAGKGVVIAEDEKAAGLTAREMLTGRMVGGAGRRIVVEECLRGVEVSFIVLSDGASFCALPVTRDHKRAYNGDLGPNTGGMGAYSDDSILSEEMRGRIVEQVVEPTLAGMQSRGTPFEGFLYCGLMLTDVGPKVLEFNVRLGDPETQPLLYRLEGGFAECLAGAARGALDSSLVHASDQSTACVVMAAGGYPGSYPKGKPIRGIREAEQTGAKVFHAGTAFSGGLPVTAGGRVLGVTARGEGLHRALENAYAATRLVHFDGVHYRTDIGRPGFQDDRAGN